MKRSKRTQYKTLKETAVSDTVLLAVLIILVVGLLITSSFLIKHIAANMNHLGELATVV